MRYSRTRSLVSLRTRRSLKAAPTFQESGCLKHALAAALPGASRLDVISTACDSTRHCKYGLLLCHLDQVGSPRSNRQSRDHIPSASNVHPRPASPRHVLSPALCATIDPQPIISVWVDLGPRCSAAGSCTRCDQNRFEAHPALPPPRKKFNKGRRKSNRKLPPRLRLLC